MIDMNNKTITLYTTSWNGYWQRFGQRWSQHVNSFNTQPDEIIIVSDAPLDTSSLNNKNVKNIVLDNVVSYKPISYYRNVATDNCSSDWCVASDLDDFPLSNYLDNLDPEADIHGFSFLDFNDNRIYISDQDSLNKRLHGLFDATLIPGTSAIKKHVFDKIRYEYNCYEDQTFYATASKLNLKIASDDNKMYRFIYSGFHSDNHHNELKRVTNIYRSILSLNRNVYAFWFSGEMNENRLSSLHTLQSLSGVNIVLINNENFPEYENQEMPIHPGFKYLSDVHKSDYARAYMMYFYGGGYSDIKANSFDWNVYFDQLFISKKDAIGYSENSFNDIGNFWNLDKNIAINVAKNHNRFVGMGHFIFKPKTKIAFEWLTEIHKKMDQAYEVLEANPAMHPYAVNGGIHSGYTKAVDPSLINPNYPFQWAELCGTLMHRLQYENNFSNFMHGMPRTNNSNYR